MLLRQRFCDQHGGGGESAAGRLLNRLFVAALLALALPAHAGAQTSLCESGRQQSPVDIAASQRQALPALRFDYRAGTARVQHDGHTVRLRVAAGSRLLIGGQPFTLQQLHFHLPGGDRLRGEDFPMAMHLLHKSRSGQLLALVLWFRLGAEHPALAGLLPDLPAQGEAERRLALDPAALLPAERGYFAYQGSLTAPPCTEGVQWLIAKQPQTLSAAQLQRLAGLIAPNAREVQPLNGRVVRESL
ncbi:carbonic anhydrase [Paucibacter soli]|uniref:carbonic anhydrase n=1 Tax=Paucibacter soli TaxID=3133433 RepID=UPI00309F0625